MHTDTHARKYLHLQASPEKTWRIELPEPAGSDAVIQLPNGWDADYWRSVGDGVSFGPTIIRIDERTWELHLSKPVDGPVWVVY